MIKIRINRQSNFSLNSRLLRSKLTEFLNNKGIVSDAEAIVTFTGDEKMRQLSSKYYKDNKIHNVLTFTDSGIASGFKYPDDGILRLGEIYVCYPEIVREAKKENKLIDEKIWELVEHGALHLMGMHHK